MKTLAQFLGCESAVADARHGAPRQFGARIVLAKFHVGSRDIVAAFFKCISVIVRIVTLKEVGVINASGCVAFVKRVHSRRKWPASDEQTCMSRPDSTGAALTALELTILGVVSGPAPQPASPKFRLPLWYRSILVHLGPKSLAKSVRETLWKCGVLLKWQWHIKSLFFGLLAPRQHQLAGALVYFTTPSPRCQEL